MFRISCLAIAMLAGALSAWAEVAPEHDPSELPEGLPNTETDVIKRIQELLRTSEFGSAIDLAAEAVDEILSRTHQYDEELVAPLTLLGDGFHALDEFPLALEAYLQARQIARIANGLHSLEQVKLLYREAGTLHAMNHIDKANAIQEHAFAIFVRKFGRDSPEIFPGLDNLAQWYLDTGNIFAARSVYRKCVAVAEDVLGTGSRPMINCLKGLGQSYRLERWGRTHARVVDRRPAVSKRERRERFQTRVNDYAPGERALLDVIRMLLEQSAPDFRELTQAKLELADWYLLFEDWKRAFVIYRNVLKSDVSGDPDSFIQQEFAHPRLLHVPYPSQPAAERRADYDRQVTASVTFHVTVSRAGTIRDLSLVSVEPESVDHRRYQNTTRYARFRPAFENGVPVVRTEIPVTYEFFYLEPR